MYNFTLFIFSVLGSIVGFLCYCILYKKTSIQRALWMAKIPILQYYFRLLTSQFLAREWSFLLHGGFSINEILDMMSQQSFRPLIREMAEGIREDLMTGTTFSDSLSNFKFLDPQFITITKHGEKTGRLDQELQFYSQFCVTQIEGRIQRLFRMIQPMMFIFIGILVVAVYLSILLPMFEMIDSI